MTILPLSEGSFTIDKTKVFVPFDTEKDDLQQRPLGSLLVEIQPFVVITRKDIILLDTGLGFTNDHGEMQIIQNLRAHGLDATDISKVLISHLHRDHAGGILEKNHQGYTGHAAFPKATYYVLEAEWKEATQHAGKSYEPDTFLNLAQTGQMELLQDHSGRVTDDIRYEMSGGHSPCHTVFWMEEDGEKVFFGGDVAPQHQQMKSRFVAKYDSDGKRSMELRQAWWEQGQKEHWTFLFYHDIRSAVVRL